MLKTRSLTSKILEVVSEGVISTFDVIGAILESGYGASYAKLDASVRRSEARRHNRELELRNRQRFSNLISKLKRDGLITGDKRSLKITEAGRKKFLKIREIERSRVIHSPFGYQAKVSRNLTIVIFHIPEKEKVKRNWLRAVLLNLGFKLLQKSVWIGRVIIPREFLKDLRNMRILEYIHIFSVSRSGTIENDKDG